MCFIVNNTWKWTHANGVSYDAAATIPNPSFWGAVQNHREHVRSVRSSPFVLRLPSLSIPPEVVDEEKERGARWVVSYPLMTQFTLKRY